jgi:NADH-quinone oxidoreductase subunit C
MFKHEALLENLQIIYKDTLVSVSYEHQEINLEVKPEHAFKALETAKLHEKLLFDQLVDVCGVDYLKYGVFDWETEPATSKGFSRAVQEGANRAFVFDKPRFAVVYHLLSTRNNWRLRIKVFLSEDNLALPSAQPLWKSADWFEREAYDLYGITFINHPDLRRILTDYGFIGHPFRKDFPLSGHVEMRYDAGLQKVVYEPVDIDVRVTTPKVIRHDNRYVHNDVAGVS